MRARYGRVLSQKYQPLLTLQSGWFCILMGTLDQQPYGFGQRVCLKRGYATRWKLKSTIYSTLNLGVPFFGWTLMEIFWAIYFNDGLLNDNDGLLNIKPDANCFFYFFFIPTKHVFGLGYLRLAVMGPLKNQAMNSLVLKKGRRKSRQISKRTTNLQTF